MVVTSGGADDTDRPEDLAGGRQLERHRRRQDCCARRTPQTPQDSRCANNRSSLRRDHSRHCRSEAAPPTASPILPRTTEAQGDPPPSTGAGRRRSDGRRPASEKNARSKSSRGMAMDANIHYASCCYHCWRIAAVHAGKTRSRTSSNDLATRSAALSSSPEVERVSCHEPPDTKWERHPLVSHHGHHRPGASHAQGDDNDRKDAATRCQQYGCHPGHGGKSSTGR